MSRFFRMQEMVFSYTAYKNKVDNTPTEEAKNNLEILMEFLDKVRFAWGSAIKVSSGYRCPILNEMVGGVKTSAHQYGWAADLIPANNKKIEFFNFFQNYLETNNLDFDELILESNSSTIWIHFSLYSSQGKQRRKIKTIKK